MSFERDFALSDRDRRPLGEISLRCMSFGRDFALSDRDLHPSNEISLPWIATDVLRMRFRVSRITIDDPYEMGTRLEDRFANFRLEVMK